jgi:hypothetical protein
MPVVLEESLFEDWMRGPPELAAERAFESGRECHPQQPRQHVRHR